MIRTPVVGGTAHRKSRRTAVSSCVLLGIAALAVPAAANSAAASPVATLAAKGQHSASLTVRTGQTVTLDKTTALRLLTI